MDTYFLYLYNYALPRMLKELFSIKTQWENIIGIFTIYNILLGGISSYIQTVELFLIDTPE